MDRFASGKASYTQGAYLLRKPEAIEKEWLPHYAKLGKEYPLRSILASGTHGDISPTSGSQARGFADAIIKYNSRPDAKARLVNATFTQFWQAVEKEQSQPGATPLPVVRGCFGHSWDLWPVSLAKYADDMREGERNFLAAEALLAIAADGRPEFMRPEWAAPWRAEWCWAMLSDHAWNGTDTNNKRHNADLRRQWTEELLSRAGYLKDEVAKALWLERAKDRCVVFNSTSFPRSVIATVLADDSWVKSNGEPASSAAPCLAWDGETEAPAQVFRSAHRAEKWIVFIARDVPAFGWKAFTLRKASVSSPPKTDLDVSRDRLENRYYRLRIDPETGGISSAIHKPTGRELVVPGKGRTLAQTILFDGKEHPLAECRRGVVRSGPVVASVETEGKARDLKVSTIFSLFAGCDTIYIGVRVKKPASTRQERLCHVFPVVGKDATIRVATAGAVVRPKRQREGDLLPGADTRRMAVQEFVDVSDRDVGMTICSLDAFALRLDLDPISFEALGNDQNYREVVQDQNGTTEFVFGYRLRAHSGGYDNAEAYAWSAAALASEFLAVSKGRLKEAGRTFPRIEIDPKRAIATCLKPADGEEPNGVILRLQETAGKNGPLAITVEGYSKAVLTDLLERDLKPLPITGGKVTLDLKPNGLAAVRLVR